jgi:hypothetical protein
VCPEFFCEKRIHFSGFVNTMKYLVVKGCLGFGDRLESLKMSVAYALKYNLQIYVDWRDPLWSHGSTDFYTYFKLVNMPVLKSLDEIPEDATYHPPYWKGNLHEHLSFEFLQKHLDDKLDLGVLKEPYNADVIVQSCVGTRALYPDSKFFGDVFRVVDERILNKVRYHASQKPLAQSWGVHIRGTDRARNFLRRMNNIQSIVLGFTTMGGMNKNDIIAVSDDKEQLEIWKRYYPRSYVVSEQSLKYATFQGNHQISKEQLQVSKDEMNVDSLVDFFVLASCERIFSTMRDSRFFQEARRLHPYVHVILSK